MCEQRLVLIVTNEESLRCLSSWIVSGTLRCFNVLQNETQSTFVLDTSSTDALEASPAQLCSLPDMQFDFRQL